MVLDKMSKDEVVKMEGLRFRCGASCREVWHGTKSQEAEKESKAYQRTTRSDIVGSPAVDGRS